MDTLLIAALLLCTVAVCSSFSFLSIGDWGDSAAKLVAPHMGEYTPEFVLAIGDNFYSDGVKSVSDPQFESKFEQTFTAPSLQVPWYVCAGNHDYYGGSKGIEAEMQYSKHSKRWIYPDYYYSSTVTAKDGTEILLVSVDTWRLNGGDTHVQFDPLTGRSALRNSSLLLQMHKEGKLDTRTRDVLLRQFEDDLSSNPFTVNPDTQQLEWIVETLKNSTADWKIVFGHFPVHSCTTQEHGDTKLLISALEPLLEQGGADVYFNGHDHILQHIQQNGINYFGSGAGAMKHSTVDSSYKGLMGYSAGHYGFMVHEGDKNSLKTTFVKDTGETPYTYTITKSITMVEMD